MSTYAVVREAGPSWVAGGIFRQPRVDEHAAFMEALAEERFLLCAGPLAGTEIGRVRVLLVVDAESEDEIRRRLAADPWAVTGQLAVSSVEPWQILVGSLRSPTAAQLQTDA
jgi:uncharacterized protein YciI